MNRCLIVVMLFVAVSQAERVDLSEAVVATPRYWESARINVRNFRNLLDGADTHFFDSDQQGNTDCVAAEKSSQSTGFFQLDMLREVEVESVELLGRDDAQYGSTQLSDFEIHISKEADADASNLCATQTGNGDYTKFNKYTCTQPMKGRYISFISTASYLTFCEIRVNGELVSPDSFVDMSTAVIDSGPTFQNKPTDRMIDGDLSQDFDNKCTAVTIDADNVIWIEFDMGSEQTVGSVEILARNDQWGVNQLKDFEIYVAAKDQTAPSNLCAVAGSTPTMLAYNTYPCQNQLKGRYLTIRKNSVADDYISICEIKVNSKGSLNDEVKESSGTCARSKQCKARPSKELTVLTFR